jgi:hypothetical protein
LNSVVKPLLTRHKYRFFGRNIDFCHTATTEGSAPASGEVLTDDIIVLEHGQGFAGRRYDRDGQTSRR